MLVTLIAAQVTFMLVVPLVTYTLSELVSPCGSIVVTVAVVVLPLLPDRTVGGGEQISLVADGLNDRLLLRAGALSLHDLREDPLFLGTEPERE